MGAFIGYGDRGVWANNRERDAFLDWFASHRCSLHDARWEYCKSPAQRYTGRCLNLEDLIETGQRLGLTREEYLDAEREYWPHLAQLLSIIEAITTGDWKLEVDNPETMKWRREEEPELDVYVRLGLLD